MAKFRRGAHVVFNRVDGEVVLFDLPSGQYFAMDKIGSRIWDLLERPSSIEGMCTRLTQEFDVSPHVCFEQVFKFTRLLLDHNLLDACSE